MIIARLSPRAVVTINGVACVLPRGSVSQDGSLLSWWISARMSPADANRMEFPARLQITIDGEACEGYLSKMSSLWHAACEVEVDVIGTGPATTAGWVSP